MFEPISWLVLLGLGILLIAIEILTLSFILIWFGIAFLIVSLLTYFELFDSALWQVVVISLISLSLLFLLRSKALKRFVNDKSKLDENFFDQKGIGVIKKGKVYFRGVFWNIAQKELEDKLKDGDKVEVLKASKGEAYIKLLDE